MVRCHIGDRNSPLRILCLGAHSDDLEIGCGGTMFRLVQERRAAVHWVVFGCSGERAEEAKGSAEALLRGASEARIDVHHFRDAFFPLQWGEIKGVFEQLKQELSPDVILTHTRRDLHQDHRVISDLSWNTFRNHFILEYEIPKYDGDLGSPNMFVALESGLLERKLQHLRTNFATQRDKRWFDEETFRGLARLRGVEAGVQYAEAFYSRKAIL